MRTASKLFIDTSEQQKKVGDLCLTDGHFSQVIPGPLFNHSLSFTSIFCPYLGVTDEPTPLELSKLRGRWFR